MKGLCYPTQLRPQCGHKFRKDYLKIPIFLSFWIFLLSIQKRTLKKL